MERSDHPLQAPLRAPLRAPLSVLVVDDEEGMREGMRRILSRRGHDVEVAESGESALECLERKTYDLALVDLKMPGISGFEVAARIGELAIVD